MAKKPKNHADPQPAAKSFTVKRKSKPLYPRPPKQKQMSLLQFLTKATPDPTDKASKQKAGTGRKMHPFDFDATRSFKNFNSHHAACINTKKASLVGLGFENANVAKTLSHMCDISLQDVMGDIAEDLEQTGNGYMEVIRKDLKANGEIIGLHHVPANVTWVNIENRRYQRHYEVIHNENDGSALWSGPQKFAAFGDLESFLRRHPKDNKEDVAEIIHFRLPTSLSRWYGMPNWLAAVAAIELKQCLYQYSYDFFLNRGVPEFLLFLTGADVGDTNMDKLEELLHSHIGFGNSHKSGIFNIPEQDIQVVLERLGMDSTQDDGFTEKSETLALDIVTAHQVPPVLAGIQIPGKLGATNEMINAMMAFQTLVVGPDQTTVENILQNTLGNPLYNAGIGLSPEAFKLKTILDEIDIQKADTAGRMREEAAGSERDLSEGLKD